MTAATAAPAITAGEARAALCMAAAAPWPASGAALREVVIAVLCLDTVLGAHRELPGTADEGLVAAAAEGLIRVMTEHCGPGWGYATACPAGITVGGDAGTESAEGGTE